MDQHIKSLIEPRLWQLLDLHPWPHLIGHIHEGHRAHVHAWDTAEPPSIQSGENILNDNIQDPNLVHTVFANAANSPSFEWHHHLTINLKYFL